MISRIRNTIALAALAALLAGTASCNEEPPRRETVTAQTPTKETVKENVVANQIDQIVPVSAAPQAARHYGYRILQKLPHDPSAFTQGLVFHENILYEGTGLYGSSAIRKLDLLSGAVQQQQALDARYFGEGIAVLKDKIYQLTWRAGIALVYDKESLALLQQFSYSGEGWGLTHDGRRLIMSDGSDLLRYIDPQSFAVTGSVRVRDGSMPVTELNELEYIKGEIFANVYRSDRIVRIDPISGAVIGWIDLSGLFSDEERFRMGMDVLNGIAYDTQNDRLFVTGKLWPLLFEIELLPR